MSLQKISSGVVHKLPADLKEKIPQAPRPSPLTRNEWICWVEDAKKLETRQKRIQRTKGDLAAGKRRPCCWPGCKHRQLNCF
ncbi:MAG: hypothetical protein COU33_02525 [Candidatus Magasanikbacteria bacterium CG10_big_fil_rev_8_21_14_0_10_43_6]|uniref:Uncharacterized protein n=1 Tax=Candidatus Magasanikbacteria bacterium CG10_big_fil_rev_8_21_14_0_10_43_6 TaxID=1974650 RepID=A0A2M6W162_9BACT|nr:MAG: hypothetical protein COU33_02525 [Candidatus Magasanikbacteria bacterium CG10_big_fil_rev_8_21_14_0_10_43_6]